MDSAALYIEELEGGYADVEEDEEEDADVEEDPEVQHGKSYEGSNAENPGQAHDQERNEYAVEVLQVVNAKLSGEVMQREKNSQTHSSASKANPTSMSVKDQVDHIVQQATSVDNLCVMYEGWTPWI